MERKREPTELKNVSVLPPQLVCFMMLPNLLIPPLFPPSLCTPPPCSATFIYLFIEEGELFDWMSEAMSAGFSLGMCGITRIFVLAFCLLPGGVCVIDDRLRENASNSCTWAAFSLIRSPCFSHLQLS
ncbi:hypothetical protein V8C42DRAFT_323085 [Trichoderma barbatum]